MKYGIQTRLKYLAPYIPSSTKISQTASERLMWIDYILKGNSIRKTSRHFDIPESTIRYWKKRFNRFKLKYLENKSTRPHNPRSSPVSLNTALTVIQLRKEYPCEGKVRLQQRLLQKGVKIGQSRIQIIINRSGLKRVNTKRKALRRVNRRHIYTVPLRQHKVPGGLVYFDVKHIKLSERKGYQFTAIDHATRFTCACVYPRITSEYACKFLDKVLEEFPFERIRYLGSDNGSEFLGLLQKYLKLKKIKHVFSSPRSPKQNPYVERVIRTIIEELFQIRGLGFDIEQQQAMLDKYLDYYNYDRSHSSLKFKTPFQEYVRLTQSSLAT